MRALLMGCVLPLVMAAGLAHAERRTGSDEGAPGRRSASEIMGDLRWGMTPAQALRVFARQIEDRYRAEMAKAPGALEADRIRERMRAALSRLSDGYVEFDGRATGWDVSFLSHEFSHNNDEAMLVIPDGESQNFYFFIQGRLWKWYKAFDQRVFQGKSFAHFADALQRRYGPGQERERHSADGRASERWMEWDYPSTRIRAIDQTDFYGFYCVVFEDKATLTTLDALRAKKPAQKSKSRSIVEMVADDGEAPDRHDNIVDRITGRIR